MAVTDPLGDLLTRIRNGQRARKDSVLSPSSKLRVRVLDVLQRVTPVPVALVARADARSLRELASQPGHVGEHRLPRQRRHRQ